ncbi:DUF5372 family protein [Streptomyces sp. NPDC091268]|uniref:DUF5372 family protein n=1 Tax=Streptomyces sp. NPDC091268 TaxID=3365979 RepID=UPI003802B654
MTAQKAAGRDASVTVTHPTHPFRGRRLQVRAVRGQGRTQLLVCDRPDGGRVAVLRCWTDRAAADPAAECGRTNPPPDRGRSGRAMPREGDGAAFRVSAAALRRLRTAVVEAVGLLAGVETPADQVPQGASAEELLGRPHAARQGLHLVGGVVDVEARAGGR